MTDELRKIEALLFLAGEAVAFTELAQRLKSTPEHTQSLVSELQLQLANHGLSIVTTVTHAQLTTSPAVAAFVQQYLHDEQSELSAAAAETLAIVAYRGPVNHIDIAAIRGVDSRRMLRQLVARGLVSSTRSTRGTLLYSVTTEFLQHLGVTNPAALPRFTELSSHEKIAKLLASQS